MQQTKKRVPEETGGIRSERKKTDSNPAKQHTEGHSYAEEAEYDAGNAIHYLSQYRTLGIVALVKAARYVKMAISRHNEGEKLLGNTLAEYIEEAGEE